MQEYSMLTLKQSFDGFVEGSQGFGQQSVKPFID